MENTNLQKALKTLTRVEWKSFGDFVESPYFNKNDKFIRFYHALDTHHGEFLISNAEKEQIYKDVTNSKTFNDPSYRNLCSDFLSLLQDFFAYEYMVKGNTTKQQFLVGALTDKQLLDLANKSLKKTAVDLQTSIDDEIEILRSETWMNDFRTLLSIYRNRSNILASNEEMLTDESYRIIGQWAFVKVAISFLNYLKAAGNSSIEPETKRIYAYLHFYESLRPFRSPIVNIYYQLVKMTLEKDDAAYFEAKKLFITSREDIRYKNHENILISLLDYANDKINSDSEWHEELFELYDLKLKDKLWTTNKGLSYASLYNAFMNALEMGRISYAEDILHQNAQYLHPAIGQSIIHLCNAWLQFTKNELDKAHTTLILVETDNQVIKYSIRTLQCLIYYEQKEWEVLNSYLESFRHFIQYNKNNVDKSVTSQFSNFCKHLAAIVKLVPYSKKQERERLAKQIRLEEKVYFRHWLLSKVNG